MAESLGEAFIEVLADTSPFGEGLGEGLEEALSGVEGQVSDALAGVPDAAGDAFGGLGEEAEGAAASVGEAFDGVADQVQESLDGINFDDVAHKIEDNLGKITVAGGGAAAASEGFARSQAESNATLARTALVTGETEESLRDMINGMVDHTFAAGDAAEGMDRLIQAGVSTKDEFEAILPAMDTFSDATGVDLVKSIDTFDRVLSALDVPFSEAEDHMDSLTFLQTQTTVSMDNLGMVMRREADNLREYGMGTDDVAVAMAALEAEGIRGPRAVMAFQNALKEGGGTLEGFRAELGVSADTLAEQEQRLADSAGMTQQFADANNATMTPLERLQQNVENLGFRFGGLASVAGTLSGAFAAIGPVAFGLTQGMQLMGKVGPTLAKGLGAITKAFNVLRVAILTNPLFLIAAVIIGIIAVIWIFRDEIMAGLGAAWDWIKNTAGVVWEWLRDTVSNVIDSVVEFVSGLREKIVEIFMAIWEFIIQYHPLAIAFRLAAEWVPKIIDWFRELRERAIEIVAGWVESLVGWIVDLWTRYMAWGQSIRDGIVDWFQNLVTTVAAAVATWVAKLLLKIQELRNRAVGFVGNLRDRVVEFIMDLAARVITTVSTWVLDVLNFVRNLRDDFGSTISELVDRAVNFIRELPGRILDVLKNARSLLLEVGKDLIRGLIDGITGMARNAVSTVGDVASDMVGAVTGVFRRQSPSRTFMDIGEDAMRGLQIGVENIGPDAIDEIERFANEAVSAGDMGAVFHEGDGLHLGGSHSRSPQALDPAGTSAGESMTVNQTIYSTDPRKAAAESVRELRAAAYLGAAFPTARGAERA